MEFKDEHDFFEELVSLRRDNIGWEAMPAAVTGGDFFSAHLEDFYDYPAAAAAPATFLSASSPGGGFSAAPPPDQGPFGYPGAELCCPFANAFSALDVAEAPVAAALGGWQAPVEEQRGCPETADAFKSEAEQCPATAVFGAGSCPDRRGGRGKRPEGQPSKNLMAERRRRKRLNDRLSMLRSIVPKISKMDRTSILGDTIDYMKELLEKINSLEEGSPEADSGRPEAKNSVKEQLKPGDPLFAVERRDSDARIEISCAGKPGMLLSTVTTLEALGLEIEQCVISCFNDFALRASCSEDLEQRRVISCEDIKQALFRNAGYGGRCL